MAETEERLVLQNFIGGKFQPPVKGNYIDNYEPATGKVYGSLPNSTKEDVDLAVAAAKATFSSWAKTPREKRSQILNKIADIIESRLDAFARAESRDQGKPVSLATTVDIPRAITNFRFFAGAILHHTEQATDMDGIATNYTIRTPAGVAGLISPWNLPLYLLTWKLAPALAVGCTVVCKPSEFASATAWMLCSVLKEAGLPDGVCNMVFGLGANCGSEIVKHPQVPLISFTGGTATGEFILKDSASQYKKVYLELGGKNPNIIFDDANLEECVNTTIRSSFSNQGEICLCGSRILVQEGIYEKFLRLFVEKNKEFGRGRSQRSQNEYGSSC
eukprot:TRINITY_DN2622_c0_g1_i1.p1 TRINITY_DN2622_c0_g1~~TRINITY_DN2622_c0_g1_i1.p1  ORF type:complete len:345 (-),score=79.72 TRINITY_DN2622_c0_g1_i1:611-1606(-)